MKKMEAGLLVCIVLMLSGCEGIRFAPGEIEKQNAWLHNRTTAIVAQTAKSENTSENLQKLANLSEIQSQAFLAFYGLPKEIPAANSVEDILKTSDTSQKALQISGERPDAFALAGTALDAAIGIAGLFGGVYGAKAAGFLKTAKQKSQALKEIIAGNEIFKKQNSEYAPAFKEAQQGQSQETKQLVTQMKS